MSCHRHTSFQPRSRGSVVARLKSPGLIIERSLLIPVAWLFLSISTLTQLSCGSSNPPPPPSEAPALSTPQTIFSLRNGTQISPIEFSNSGGAIASCAVTPSLPANLTIDSNNCRIEGTPTNISPQIISYLVSATNVAGTGSISIDLRVNAVRASTPDPEQTLSIVLGSENPHPEPFLLPLGVEVLISKRADTISPNLQAGGILIENTSTVKITSCTILPVLPPGLSLLSNPYHCLVQGTPTTPSERTSYTVTATATPPPEDTTMPDGTEPETPTPTPTPQTASISFDIEVPIETMLPRLVDAGERRLFVNSRTNLPIVFENTGISLSQVVENLDMEDMAESATARCIITPVNLSEFQGFGADLDVFPELPMGWISELSADESSCQVNIAQAGVPAITPGADGVVPDSVRYRIRVAGLDTAERASNALVKIELFNSAPPNVVVVPALSVPGEVALMHLSQTNLPFILSNSGGAATSCRIDISNDPIALPSGLELSLSGAIGAGTCAIIGTPVEVQREARSYTIVAANSAGESRAVVNIGIEPVRPLFADEVIITPNEPGMDVFSFPDDEMEFGFSSGDPVNITLDNEGGVASYCRFIADPGSDATFIHPDYTIALAADGTSCALTGTAPANTDPEGEEVTQVAYAEIGNRYDQKSIFRVILRINP